MISLISFPELLMIVGGNSARRGTSSMLAGSIKPDAKKCYPGAKN
jgi:hypothetical protein